jgi:hypothetical protein
MSEKRLSINMLQNIIDSKETELKSLKNLLKWMKENEFAKSDPKMDTIFWRMLLAYK